ncbi:tRNA (N6-threonylcarbamoyladenosine(37)-N6)-methyltransferase TrmO [Fibrobacter sp. UWH4]|uniref:tRNA (N6-threonylcarbamoyladenosine(37)-N6)-methyltransferase TrmO n=1 Tax=Fibrobacter sp. UWH4 TaxID=1896210 RepID=UPI00091FD10D|nr:tRNA (N6-threonylcarbamoyladenosine(37)-N6)-methyltransferase TrmO [Fibrobacter sp. UWH4]SHK26799.1 tRNA-Thr(GGU) m(6)t(6)A37 methyltransferase TsaA [Fibrobacter sp. UWH4]
MQISPIGKFYGDAVYKYDAPRQGRLFAGHPGCIELAAGQNFEMALRDLEGFERIWVIFQFHENEGWRPTTRPPVPPKGKDRVGTFASRSPYRPNPIGLSCVRLLKVEGLTLFVDEADLLNGTPVLDIKPYIPMADAFPDAKAGWVEEQVGDLWTVEMSDDFSAQHRWIVEHSDFNLESFAQVQLSRGNFSKDVFDSSRRRLTVDTSAHAGVLAYRTFRIHFSYDEPARCVLLQRISSGYSAEDLKPGAEDKYGDKELHRDFLCCRRPGTK